MTTPVSGFIILSEVVPANLPSPDSEQIVVLCKNVGDKISGFPFADPSSGTLLAWFKYGPNVAMDEALTQAAGWVEEHLETMPEIGVKVPRVYMTFTSAHSFCDIGYIIIEYMAAPDCKSRGCALVIKIAKEVEELLVFDDCKGAMMQTQRRH